MNAKKENGKEYALWQLISRTYLSIRKVRERELNQYDISMSTAGFLSELLRLGKQASIGKISKIHSLARHSVSEHITRMEKDGLIEKVKCPGKDRILEIKVTQKGTEAYRKSSKRESVKCVMSALTEEEQSTLWKLLSKLRDQAIECAGESLSEERYPPSDPAKL